MPDPRDLLEKTSRTFALSIPVLPEPTRREVMIAYLLFRIADTFEDASHWPPDARIAALADFNRLLRALLARGGRAPRARLGRSPRSPTTPATGADGRGPVRPRRLLRALARGDRAHPRARRRARPRAWPRSSPARATGSLTLALGPGAARTTATSWPGIVGEMLSELFLLDRPALCRHRFVPARARRDLRRSAPARQHPEGLRHRRRGRAAATSRRRSRRSRSSRSPARDLGVAGEYIRALQSAAAPRGLVEFTALPVQLAWAALERVEKHGPGLQGLAPGGLPDHAAAEAGAGQK